MSERRAMSGGRATSGRQAAGARHLIGPAVVLLVLAVLTLWRETSRPGAEFQVEGEAVRLYTRPVEPDAVARVQVTAPDGTSGFELTRDARGLWRVDRPFVAPAAPGRVTRLVEQVLGAEAEARTDDTSLLGDFLLDDDQAVRVRLTSAGGDTVADLAMGATSGPAGAFVRRLDGGESRILAVTSDLRGTLGLPPARAGADPTAPAPEHFHDTSFPGRPLPDARRLHLRVPGRDLTVERPGRSWELAPGTAPGPLRVDGVRQVVHQLEGGLEIAGLLDPARAAELGFDEPAYVTELVRADGSRLRLEGAHVFDQETGEHTYHARLPALADPPVLWRLGPVAFGLAFPDGDQVVSLTALRPPILRGDVLGLAVEHGDPARSWTARRDRPRSPWTVVDPGSPLTTDTAAVGRVAGRLADLTPVDWLTEDALGPASPLRISMGRPDADEPPATLTNLGLAPDFRGIAFEPSWAQVPLVYRSNDLVRALPQNFDLFRKRIFERWIPEDLRELTVDTPETQPLTLRWSQGDWRLADADADVVDERLIAWVRRLMALEVVEPDATPVDTTATLGLLRKDGARLTALFGRTEDGRPTLSLGEHSFVLDRPGTVLTRDQLVR